MLNTINFTLNGIDICAKLDTLMKLNSHLQDTLTWLDTISQYQRTLSPGLMEYIQDTLSH